MKKEVISKEDIPLSDSQDRSEVSQMMMLTFYLSNSLFALLLAGEEEMEGVNINEIKKEPSPVPFDPPDEEDMGDVEIKVEVSEEIATTDYTPSDIQATDGENTNSSEATSMSDSGDTSKASQRNVARRGRRKGGATKGIGEL